MKWLAWLGCACVALATVSACSGDEGKKTERGEDGGAAGEISTAPGGGGQGPSGGQPTDGGVPTIPQGGVPVEAGAGGVSEAGAAGAGGVPSAEISLATLQGTWTGHLLDSYVCESDVESTRVTIEGSTITTNWPNEETSSTGEVVQQSGAAFTFGLHYEEASFNEDFRAQLFVHPSGKYALVVLQAIPGVEEGTRDIVLGILQKAEATGTSPDMDAIVGDWQGTGFELDESLRFVEQFESSATFTPSEGLLMTGEDRDGAFEGGGGYEEPYAYSASAHQGDNEIGLMMLVSDDAKVLAVAMLRDLSESNGALCNLDDPYADMSVHKFALWDKIFD